MISENVVLWCVLELKKLVLWLFQSFRAGFRVFAVLEEDVEKKASSWGPLFDVEDPRPKVPPSKGKILDANQALEVARFDIQYCDWRARQDVLTIMLLHEKVSFVILLLSPACFLTSSPLSRLWRFLTPWPANTSLSAPWRRSSTSCRRNYRELIHRSAKLLKWPIMLFV